MDTKICRTLQHLVVAQQQPRQHNNSKNAKKMNHMLNPANIEIKTVESSEKRKETSHLVFQEHLVVTQQQTMPHNNKKLCKKLKHVESSEYRNQDS